MSMNSAPSGVRTHIGLFGRRNAGKSSLVNALTGQNLAIVSEVKGTTTDPVQKAMELLPLGPVVMIDTPGLDDEGELGQKRVEKSFQVLRKTDIALLVVDAAEGMQAQDRALLARVKEMNLPYLVVYNKCDEQDRPMEDEAHAICVSAKTGRGVTELKERIAHLTPDDAHKVPLIADLIDPMDYIVLVVPIDSAMRAMPAVDTLKDGDTVLIAEGCTHHRQCEDIGTVKIPKWLRAHSGCNLNIETCSGTEFPQDLSRYKLVIHCGGCMLNDREVLYRLNEAARQGVPFVNYGLLIAHMKGIFDRATELFR